MASDMAQLEALFLALGDRTRLRLLSLMAAGPVPVGRLVDLTGESQPKVSRHLAYLRNCGIATTERDGKQIFYTVNLDGDTPTGRMLAAVMGSLTGQQVEHDGRADREGTVRRSVRAVSDADVYVQADVTSLSSDGPAMHRADKTDSQGTANDRDELEVFLL